jgi:hypothetical protein
VDRSRLHRLAWLFVAAALIALRIPHLVGPLVDPHSWRQCDTVHTSLDFYHRGLDVLHPAVCWLGAHRTILLNFPLGEAITSQVYRVFGPDPMWDRIVQLAFFILSAVWLHALAAHLAGTRAARLTTLAYFALPLGQYFSRVPHIDFSVLAFVNGALYYANLACSRRSTAAALAAAACGVLAALVKAPYLGTTAFALIVLLIATWSLPNLLRLGLAYGVPAVVFLFWREYVDKVNATVPDWYFLPDFYKEVNPLWRYTGTLAERQDIRNWIKLAKRMVYEIATPLGCLFALAMPMWGRVASLAATPAADGTTARRPDARWFVIAWLAGCVLYVLVFFRLNAWHNYYQTPFLAPIALLIALGVDALWDRLPRLGAVPLTGILFAAFLVIAAWLPSRLGYDQVDWLRTEAGPVIAARVPEGQLVVAGDFNTLPPTDPRLLFRAGREGWPMRVHEITAERLDKLRPYGARWVVVLTDPQHPDIQPPAFLEPMRVATDPVMHAGRQIGMVYVYDLTRASAVAP